MTKHTNADGYRELFGEPNDDGVFLVGVVEFSDDANEDQWSYVGNSQMGTLESIAHDFGYARGDITIAEPYRAPGYGVLPDGTELAVTSTIVSGSPPWHQTSREPTTEERLTWAGFPVPPPTSPEPIPLGPNMETARPRIEEHQGEVFCTGSGRPFTYETYRYTLVIVESRRNVQWHEIGSALEEWPISGPAEIPRCPERSGRYVYGIVSDERIRRGDW
jgi:hypothetical protein